MRDTQPLRIALFTHSVNPRGGVVHALELASALHEAGHRVTVFVPAEPGQRLFRELPCRVLLMPVAVAPRDLAGLVAGRIAECAAFLGAHFRDGDFDIWHAQDSITGNVLATLCEQGHIAEFTRTVHHLDPFSEPRLAAWQQRAFAEAAQVFCVSALWQRVLRDEHGIAAEIVPNGVDLRRHAPPGAATDTTQDLAVAHALGLRPGAPLFLCVGGVEARKNTVRALQAFIDVRRERPAAQLVVAGGASLLDHGSYAREFHAVLHAAGLPSDAVRLTGPVPDAWMPALFRLADALLMPSLREGFGLVVLEALASGTPAVVSRIAPFTDHLQHTAAIAWADPQDSASIARAMREALSLPAFSEPPPVCHQHSWARSAERHLALYRAQRRVPEKAAGAASGPTPARCAATH